MRRADLVISPDLRKEPTLKVVNIGDLVQWTDGGIDQFETPRRVRGVQTHEGQEWVFVEGTATRVPLSKLVVVTPASGATAAPPTMALPDLVVMGSMSEERDWLPGKWFGPERHISRWSLLPLTLAFALGAVAATVGIYAFQRMNSPPAPPPMAMTATPMLVPSPMPAPPTVQPPPVAAALNTSEVWELQQRLGFLGMQPGSVDGVAGPQTTAAIKRYEESKGQPQTGKLDRKLLERLRQEPN